MIGVRRKECFWMLAFFGAGLAAAGLVCAYVVFPMLVRWQVDNELDLWNRHSEGYRNFVCTVLYVVNGTSN